MRTVSLQGHDLENLAAAILQQGGSFRFVAHGGSMIPFVRDGDTLTIHAAEGPDLEVGDVALYRRESGDIVAHRVVTRGQGREISLTVRGDAYYGPDEVISGKQVIGQVVRVERNGKIWNLGQGSWRLLAQFWMGTRPVGPVLLRLARAAKRAIA